MKNIIIVILLIVAGYFAYTYIAGPGPLKIYLKFAKAWADDKYDEAAKYVEGDAVKQVVKEMAPSRMIYPNSIATFHGAHHTIQSQSYSADKKEFSLNVEQKIYFDPPGVLGGNALNATMFALFRHEVMLRKTGAGWRVVSFKPTALQVDVNRRK